MIHELTPKPGEVVQRVLADLRIGLPVVIANGETGILALAVETASDDRMQWISKQKGAVVAITDRRARTLKGRVYDEDISRIRIPGDARPSWLRSIADPSSDLDYPMKGPLIAERTGDPGPFRRAVYLARSARLLPAIVGAPVADPALAAKSNRLTLVGPEHAAGCFRDTPRISCLATARLPLEACEDSRVHVFRSGHESDEHCAIEIGRPPRSRPVLARLHSACFTGDVLGSLKCDCGPQLQHAMKSMSGEEGGILLYLNQEGRGIGLTNKVRAYTLQDQGFDTVEANHRLGFEDDERDFRIGAEILRLLGFGSVRLMTNNPAKSRLLESQGIEVVERIPLAVGQTPFNESYLAVKASKSGHIL